MTQPQAHLSASASGGHSRETQGSDQVIAAVRDALGRLRFGTVHLTIHDGRVVQMDVTEKCVFQTASGLWLAFAGGFATLLHLPVDLRELRGMRAAAR